MTRLPADEELALPGADLRYVADYIAQPDALFASLREGIDWQQPQLKVFGRWHRTPRLVSFVGDDGVAYRYSGQRHLAQPWPAPLLELKQRLQTDFALHFNSALLNFYRDGNDSMGWHSDDEPELGDAPAIASLSVGALREFRLRPFPGRSQRDCSPQTISLASGSLLLMLPPTQHYWQHCLPRRAHRGPRINITFRLIDPAYCHHGSNSGN